MRRILALAIVSIAAGSASAYADVTHSSSMGSTRARDLMAALPLRFEANEGQTDPRVKFLARGPNYALFLTPDEIVLARKADAIRLSFRGANRDARLVPIDRLPGKTNILLGSDAAKWQTGIHGYAKIRYEDIYPGIDLVFYGNGQQLEYDLIVNPGADPRRIRLAIDGTGGLRTDNGGDLLAQTAEGEIRFRRPHIYQSVEGRPARVIEGRYQVKGRSVSFELGPYDKTSPLVIDPIVVFQTYLGGNGDDNLFFGTRMIATDADGAAYITTSTSSSNFPTTAGALLQAPYINVSATEDGREPCTVQGVFTPGTGSTLLVVKIAPDGGSLVYATYLGATHSIFDHHCGGPLDYVNAIAVDAFGNAYIAGNTLSNDFPETTGTVRINPEGQLEEAGGNGMYVAKLNADGSGLVYSARFGYMSNPTIAVGGDGSVYMTGQADNSLPVTQGAYQQWCDRVPQYGCFPSVVSPHWDAFALKLNPTGSFIEYGTYLGGSAVDLGKSISVDAAGQVYITGMTRSDDFPTTPGAMPYPAPSGNYFDNLFVAKVNANGTDVIFSTYLAGREQEQPGSITLGADGSVYVTGSTQSPDFPTTPGVVQEVRPPTGGLSLFPFVTKFTPGGTVVYSTYLPYSGNGLGIGVDGSGRAWIGGASEANIVEIDPVQAPRCTNCQQAIIAALNPDASALVLSSYIGGGYVQSLALDPDGDAFVVGPSGTDLPLVNPLQPVNAGSGELFVAKVALSNVPGVTWPAPAGIGYGTALDGTQLNATANIAGTFTYDPPAGTVLHAGNARSLSVTFTPTDSRWQTVVRTTSIDVATASLTVSANASAKVFGAPLPAFTASYSGFVNGDTPASLAGTLTFSTAATSSSGVGAYAVTPGGLSSSDYSIAFTPGTLSINPAATAAAMAAVPASAGFLQPVVAVAGVGTLPPGAGSPDGTVQFMDGSTLVGTALISGGTAAVVLNGLSSGVHTLTAVYSGSGSFTGSTSAPVTLTVRSLAQSTFTILALGNNPSAAGQPAVMSAVVLPLGGGTPTGTVQFLDGNTPLGTIPIVNGIATLSTAGLGAGLHFIQARYLGNATFAPSAAPGALLTVYAGARPGTTTLDLAGSPSPSTLGQPVTFTATVRPASPGAPAGVVVFFVDGYIAGSGVVANVGGLFKASASIQGLTLGAHVVTALYTGDGVFASSNSAPALQGVTSAPPSSGTP